MNGNYWKYGLTLGAGMAIGALGAILLSKNPGCVKKTAADLLGRSMDLKDKAAEFMETAKENMEDLAAEARHSRERRKTEEA